MLPSHCRIGGTRVLPRLPYEFHRFESELHDLSAPARRKTGLSGSAIPFRKSSEESLHAVVPMSAGIQFGKEMKSVEFGGVGDFFFTRLLDTATGKHETGQDKLVFLGRMHQTDAKPRLTFILVIGYGQHSSNA
jgi:hypothetical protein